MKSILFGACLLFMSIGFCESWKEAQIHSDLAYWKESGISKSLVQKAFEVGSGKSLDLMHVTYANGAWTFLPEADIEGHGVSKILADLIPKVIGERSLPESFEFIITLHDRVPEECSFEVPVFGFAKNRENKNAICIPDFESLSTYPFLKKGMAKGSLIYPWDEKKELAFWRGVTTGGLFTLDNCLDYPRSKLVMMSVEAPSLLDARFTRYVQLDSEDVREKLKLFCPLAPSLSPKEHLQYKYLINVDGNSCSYSRMFWIMLSNSLLIKQESDEIQWYYGKIKPWVHYVPLETDLSDLFARIEWAKEHDSEAQEMAKSATELAVEIFSEESMGDYLQKLFIAYESCFR